MESSTILDIVNIIAALGVFGAFGGILYNWYHRPRLRIRSREPEPRIHTISFADHAVRNGKCVVFNLENAGLSIAKRCLARAIATSMDEQRRDCYLHWAVINPIPPDFQDIDSVVNINATEHSCLDIAFTEEDHDGCWLATPRALINADRRPAALTLGRKYRIEIIVTANDGKIEKKFVLYLTPPQDHRNWDRLEAVESPSWWKIW